MKHKFKLTRLWVASLLLLFGVSQPAWANLKSGQYIYICTDNCGNFNTSGGKPGLNMEKSAGGWLTPDNTCGSTSKVENNVWAYKLNNEVKSAQISRRSGSCEDWGGWSSTISSLSDSKNYFTMSEDGWSWTLSQNNPKYFCMTTGKTIYFDNTSTNWTKPYIRYGRDTHAQSPAMTKVAGTKNLWQWSSVNYDHYKAYTIADSYGWTDNNSVYNTNNMQNRLVYYEEALTGDVTIIAGSKGGTAGTPSINYYNATKTSGLKTYSVSWSTTNGSLIVKKYTDDSNTTSISSGDEVLPTQYITIEASPNTGYHLNGSISVTGATYDSGKGAYYVTGTCTISATFTANSYKVTLYPNGGTINSGEVTQYTYGVGATLPTSSDITKAGYDFQGWYTNDQFSGDPVATIGTTETGAKSYWAKWTPKTYEVYFTGEHFTPSFTSGTKKAYASIVEFTLTPAIDYAIDQVTSSDVTVTKNGETYSFTMPNNAVTINVTTYSTAVTTYLIRFMNGETILQEGQVEENTLPEYKGATPTKAKTAEYTYTFSGWNPEIAVATKAQDYQAQFNQTPNSYTLTWNLNGGNITTAGTAAGSVAYGTALTAPIVEKTGYTFTSWNPEVPATMPAANATYAAQWSEKTVTLTPTVNDDNMGTVSGGGSVGIATGQTITANNKSGYKFDHWVLSSNLIIQNSKKNTDNQITVKTNGDGEAVSAQAVFVEDLSTGVYLKGEGNFGGWGAAGFEFMKPTGQSTGNDAYVTIHTTNFEEFWNVQFAVFENGKAMGANGWYFFNSTISTTFSQLTGTYTNPSFFSTVAGDYVFHYNTQTKEFNIEYPHYNCVAVNHTDSWSIHPLVNNEATINLEGSKSYKFCVIYDGAMYANLNDNITSSQKEIKLYNNFESFNHKIWINTVKGGNYVFNFDHSNDDHLTVTYPEESYQTVTVYEDGITPTEVKVYEVSKPSITAKVPEGMNFNSWVTTGDATVANASATTTTVTNAGTNGTVKATFNTNQYIYFKDGVYDKYGNVWVTFRKTDYWDNSNGSGNKDLSYAALGMTKIKNTDIHYFHIDNEHATWDEVTWGIVQFTNSGNIQQNFYLTKVAYPHHNNSKSCYRACLPLFVPRDWITTNINSSQYYNDGIWMKYNSTESGFRIKGSWDSWKSDDYKFVAETPGGYEFKTTLQLTAGTTYDFKIYDDDDRTYSIKGVMTATSCSNWHMYMDQDNCQITASETGNYTFILNLGSGEVIVSVEYPLSNDDYRVVAKQSSEVKWEGDLIKNSKNVAKKDTTSFFNNHYTYQLQRYAGGDAWNNVGSEVTIVDAKAQEGVITLIVTQDEEGNATLAYEGIYTGNYYIRTDGVDGGWGDYKNNSDNKMDNYGSLIVADPDYQYDVYKAKWVPSGKNVKFRVANDYSKAISDELKGDYVIGTDKETLPEGANVRFMWNSTTNELKRAYLSGSTDDEKRYLMLINTNHLMYDKTGETQINELKFTDNNNWVYQADIQAKPGCEVKLTAQYNSKVQYFIGSETTTRKIIDGSGDTKYTLRAVYDFKTNRLVAGWIPSDTIDDNIVLGSDMLIERIEHGDASQIVFGGASAASLSISEIQHIYGVLKLTKTSMLNATETSYDKCIYWISFPFDVKVSEIFGVEKYGEVWAISNYRGDLRAQKGWFKQDTQTFWEFLKPSDIMKANVGYTLNLDPDYFNKESSEPWKNSAEEVAWYFPSIKEKVGIVSLAQKDTTLPAQHCEIDREFNAGTEVKPRWVNHKFTDSNWRVIGVPAFQNLQAPTMTPTKDVDDKVFGLTGFYEWVSATNTYKAQSTDGYPFHATHSYMVQYEGTIRWSNAAVITTNKAPWHAPEYTYADAKNYSIKLEFGNDDYTDQTFVTLIEKASTDFVLNEDMMKIDNAGFPNIYSFAGAYNVAYNETTFDNQMVVLGVSAPKDGSYTFAMPKDFSGKAVLVDLESGEATDLNLSNYTVELNKGTYNNRFQLLLEVEAKIPTAIDNAKGEWSADGKTKKLLINDQIYLINAGRVYNATGTMVR